MSLFGQGRLQETTGKVRTQTVLVVDDVRQIKSRQKGTTVSSIDIVLHHFSTIATSLKQQSREMTGDDRTG